MTKTGLLVVVGVVFAASTSSIAVASFSDERGDRLIQTLINESNGLSKTEAAKLFSRDTDDEDHTTRNQSGLGVVLDKTDYAWTAPPTTPETWTRTDVQRFATNFTTSSDQSVHPPHAELESESVGSDGGVKDAHATLLSVHPATRTYLNESASRTYLGQQGRAFGLVDYRVEPPADDTNDADGKLVHWSVESHEITSVCVLQGIDEPRATCSREGARIAHGEGQHVVNLSYDANGVGETATSFVLAAEIHVRYEKTVETRHSETREKCWKVKTPNGTKTECEEYTETWWTEETTHPDQDVTVTDELDPVTFYRLQSAVRYARFPNGEMGVVVQSSHRWAGLKFPGHGAVSTPWKFFTMRDPRWDSLQTSTSGETTTAESPVHPVRVFAYPADTDPRGRTSDHDAYLTIEAVIHGTTYASPKSQLPSSVDVNVVEASHTPPRTVAVRYSEFAPELAVTGLVAGADGDQVNISATSGVVDVHRSNLTAEIIASNTTHVAVRVELRDAETGDPIDLRSRDGYVSVGDHRVNTNASGQVIVTVEKTPSIGVRYRPVSWWEASPAFTGNRTRVHPNAQFFTVNVQGKIWTQILGVLTPFLFLFYLLDQLPGTDAWPPWSLW